MRIEGDAWYFSQFSCFCWNKIICYCMWYCMWLCQSMWFVIVCDIVCDSGRGHILVCILYSAKQAFSAISLIHRQTNTQADQFANGGALITCLNIQLGHFIKVLRAHSLNQFGNNVGYFIKARLNKQEIHLRRRSLGIIQTTKQNRCRAIQLVAAEPGLVVGRISSVFHWCKSFKGKNSMHFNFPKL